MGRSSSRPYPSLRQRNPMAYWTMMLVVVAMLIGPVVVLVQAIF